MRDRIRGIANGVQGAVKPAILGCLMLISLMAAGLSTLGLTDARAQLGPLYGGRILLSNGTNTITLKDTSMAFTNYTMTLPSAQSAASSTQWLQIASTGGGLSWTSSLGSLSGSAINYSTTSPQEYASTSNYLFDLQALSPTSPAPPVNASAPGGVINSTVTGVSDNATGLTVYVANTLASATGVTELGGEFFAKAYTNDATFTSISVNVGLSSTASGHGTNYPALFTDGNVGIGTSNPLELLDVNGNIKISGVNGLRITEGSNATMGIATLVSGTVPVSTSKVTASSRIFLMDQTPGTGTHGTPYVNARTPGTSFTIKSTGSSDNATVAWWLVEPAFDQVYTSSSTLVVPTGVTSILISGVGGAGGGGGGGGRSTATGHPGGGGGGGAGEYISTTRIAVTAGETLTITIPAAVSGGGGGSTSGGNGSVGTTGGTVTVADPTPTTLFSANGGSGGAGGTGANSSTNGGGGTGGPGGVVSGSIPSASGTAGNAGTIGGTGGASGGTAGPGGIGPTGGQSNTGGAGGAGATTSSTAGATGSSGTSGYIEIAY